MEGDFWYVYMLRSQVDRAVRHTLRFERVSAF